MTWGHEMESEQPRDRQPRVRIIEKKVRLSFGERLEARASEIVRGDHSIERDPVTSTIEREIALTLGHLNRARALHRNIHLNLLHQECYLDTEIMQREPTPPVYRDPRLPERDRLRDRLRDIERERRNLAAIYEEKLQALRDRLLVLLNRHAVLRP